MTAVCSSCGAEIIWTLTEKGRRAPLDATPVPDGNIIVTDGISHVLGLDDDIPFLAYKNHFSTCPNAEQHRKKR